MKQPIERRRVAVIAVYLDRPVMSDAALGVDRWIVANGGEIFFNPTFIDPAYSTQSVPQAVLNMLPQDRITIFLDFSQPPALDFSRLPTLPTPNESNFEIAAVDEGWFIVSKTRLAEFFHRHRSGYDWIHRAAIYDILLFTCGLPLAIWSTVKIDSIIPAINNLASFPRILIYIYIFACSLMLFRILFSYARWVFPKIEVETEDRGSPLRHRAVWALALTALFWPALYDAVKFGVGFLASK